jgi:EAL domain-containing protein (putative c-di-GMP-specific phosphodiesterase class I)
VLVILNELRLLGVGISMDDFGTGYSSLSYLRRFPFTKIKIDQCFVRSLFENDGLAIVRAVIGLGRSLNMTVTAEGVETAEQLQALAAEGCCDVQGYYFSPPKPVGQALALLDRPLVAAALAAPERRSQDEPVAA